MAAADEVVLCGFPIPRLTHKSMYLGWKDRLFALMDARGFLAAVQHEFNPQEFDTYFLWEHKKRWATCYIKLTIDNDHLELVRNEPTPYDMIQRLDNKYLDETSVKTLKRDLLNLKFNDFDDPAKFFLAVEKIMNLLKAAGSPLSGSEVLMKLSLLLPRKYMEPWLDWENEEAVSAVAEHKYIIDFVEKKVVSVIKSENEMKTKNDALMAARRKPNSANDPVHRQSTGNRPIMSVESKQYVKDSENEDKT